MTAQTSGTGVDSGADKPPATEQAKQAAGTAAEEGKHVARVATDEAKSVASEVTNQARDLLGELRSQVSEQAGTQRDRLVEALHQFTAELDSMVDAGGGSGVATEVVRQLSSKAKNVCSMVEGREPGDVVDEVRGMARRKPSTFILGAALAGVLAGRLTRGSRTDTSPSSGPSREIANRPASPPASGTATSGTPASTAPVREVPPVGGPTSMDPVEPGLQATAYPDDRRTSGGNP